MSQGKFTNWKRAGSIFVICLFLLVLIFYFRKRGEESIIPSFDNAWKKKSSLQTVIPNSIETHLSQKSHDVDKIQSPEKIPDPFSDLEPSTPVLAMLYGKAMNKDGSELPGVQVSVYSDESPNVLEVLASCFTDEQGRYRFASLPVTYFRILATKPGYYLEYEHVAFSLRKLSIEQNFQMSKGGLSLAGTVQDYNGKAVEDASVLLHLPDSHLFLRETSDDKGGFRFDGLSRESADLTVTAPGFEAFSQRAVIIGNEDMRIILSPELGTRIKGKVLYYGSGEPAPNAAIVIERDIRRFGKHSSLLFTAKADEMGVYETVSLSSGKYKLSASCDSFIAESQMKKEISLLEGGAEEIWLDLFLPGSHDIRGRVLDAENNQPVPGALVRTYSIPPKTAETDLQGRFRILDTGTLSFPNQINLSSEAPGYAFAFKTIRNISYNIPPVVLKLRKSARVYGTIYSSLGVPVPNAMWQIQLLSTQQHSTSVLPFTDDQGQYEEIVPIDWLGKQVYLYAYSPKHGYGYDVFTIPEELREIKRDLTLSPGITVTVMVLDKQGEGIKDCTIHSKTWKQNETALSHEMDTDIEGCAVFENLPQSLFEFYAHDHRNNLSKTRTLDLTSLEGPQEIVFSLDEPEEALRVVYGRVTDEQKSPLKEVLVESYFVRKETLTDSEGCYRIEMTSREEMSGSEIGFSKSGYVIHTRSFNSDQKEARLDVVMKKQDSMVFFGTMVTRKGDFPTEADIEICMKDENNAVWSLGSQMVSLFQGGVFEYRFNPMYYKVGRTYFIKARDYAYGSGRSQEIKDEGNASLGPFEIVLSRGMLKGFLRDGKTGNTVSRGLISTLEINRGNYDRFETRTWGSGAYTKSDENGYFELSPLSLGSSEIYIYHPEYWIQKKTSPEITQENLEREWNLFLDPCSSLEGRILNSDGIPLSGVEISINSTAPARNNSQYFSWSLETDEQGRYWFKGIPPGEYYLYHSIRETFSSYSCFMKREYLSLTGSEQRILDIHVPKLVPAVFQTKKSNTIYIEPLYTAEYTRIDIHLHGMDPDNGYRILLPLGRYHMRFDHAEKPVREIEIHPTEENRITDSFLP